MEIHNQINQTLVQFQALLTKALQQNSRTLFRLSVGKLQEVEPLLESLAETIAESIAETNLQPDSDSDSFKESSDSISNEEHLTDIQEEVQIENKGETNEKDS